MSLAVLLGAGGLVVMAIALFRDRSRGRPRCPKCWYDMSGVAGLKCPECGHEARHARKLLKTRRRWRRAVLGALMIALAVVGAVGEPMIRHGAAKGAPTWALIAALPRLDRYEGMRELQRRSESGSMRQWEYRWLRASVRRELERDSAPTNRMYLFRILEADIKGPDVVSGALLAEWPAQSDEDVKATLRLLLHLLERSAPDVRVGAFQCLEGYRERAAPAIPILVGRLTHETPSIKQIAASSLFRVDPKVDPVLGILRMQDSVLSIPDETRWKDAERKTLGALRALDIGDARGVDLLCELLRSPNEEIRRLAAWSLWRTAPDRPDIQALMITLMDDQSPFVRAVAAAFHADHPDLPGAAAVLPKAMSDTDWHVLAQGLKLAIESRSTGALPEIQKYFGPLAPTDPRRTLLNDAAGCLGCGSAGCSGRHGRDTRPHFRG